MSRCQLWRYQPGGGGNRHAAPGEDRKTWAPCHARVGAEATGCDECYRALLRCPNRDVRLSLARDPRTPSRVLRWLATDGDDAVLQQARMRLDEGFLPDLDLEASTEPGRLPAVAPIPDSSIPAPPPLPMAPKGRRSA